MKYQKFCRHPHGPTKKNAHEDSGLTAGESKIVLTIFVFFVLTTTKGMHCLSRCDPYSMFSFADGGGHRGAAPRSVSSRFTEKETFLRRRGIGQEPVDQVLIGLVAGFVDSKTNSSA